MPLDRIEDRRVRKTKRLLRDALAALVHEKPLEAVVVKEILARADVGRSTFYAHFRDKDDLLASTVRETLRAGEAGVPARPDDPAADVLRFSLPLFEHVARHLDGGGLSDARARAALHEHLQREVERLVEDRLRGPRRGRNGDGHALPPELLARQVAATFALVLDWWVERRPRPSGREADAHFRALVLPVLREAVSSPPGSRRSVP
jgi:AcrR family transcriptional regulator